MYLDEDDEREALRREIRAGGARIAFNALKSVCQDSKAPAQAKATAGTTILRAAGLFEKQEETNNSDLHKVPPEKLANEIARLEAEEARRVQQNKTAAAVDRESGGVFD